MSGTPSPFQSPTCATDTPNPSSRFRLGPPFRLWAIFVVPFTVPSRFIIITYAAPVSGRVALWSSEEAPAARSGTPSPSRSPKNDTDTPNMSLSSRPGPLSVVSSIFTVPSTNLLKSTGMTCTAPLSLPPASSPVAPAAISGTPSPSRSPMYATENPNLSPSSSGGPFSELLWVSVVSITVPSVFMSMTCTAPLVSPPASSPVAPTAISGTPSPLRSPNDATDTPKKSSLSRRGPFSVPLSIPAVRFMEPSRFMSMTCTAPLLTPPASSQGAPAARSGTPSPSRSPTYAKDVPKTSSLFRRGPFAVVLLISTVRFTRPSTFVMLSRFMNIMCTAPLLAPPASSPLAPTARAGTPSPSRSLSSATDDPNLSPSARAGPFMVVSLISTVCFTVPSRFISIMCTAPLLLPPAPLSPGAPTAMSGTPSPSRSPSGATDTPKPSLASRRGPFAVMLLISTVLPMEWSRFLNMTCTAPLLAPPASSPVAPAAMSGTPSPLRSPSGATDTPKPSLASRRGPFALDPSIFMVFRMRPSAFTGMM